MDLITSLPMGELVSLGIGMLIAGMLTGILAGVFGVGGGAVIVPVLAELFDHLNVTDGVEMQLAVGTSLAVIVPTSIRSFRAHYLHGAVDMRALKVWAIPTVLGCFAGAAIAAYVSSDAMKIFFVLFAVFIAGKMLFGRASWRVGEDLPGVAGMSVYGFVIGVMSALMGIGGGSFGSLVFSLHNRPIHQAIATSAGLGVLISIPGAIGFVVAGWPRMAELPPLSLGFVSLIGIALLAPVSVLTAPLGVRLAHGMTKRRLELAFGLFLSLIALRFIWDLAT